MNAVESLLRQMNAGFVSLGGQPIPIYSYVVANGKEFSPTQPPAEGIRDLVGKWAARLVPVPGYCFWNSQRLARASRGKLTYCEGYAFSALAFPVLHAWCVDSSGAVIDVTWSPIGTSYFGVCFTLKQIKGVRGHSLIDDWENGWPLFRSSPLPGVAASYSLGTTQLSAPTR